MRKYLGAFLLWACFSSLLHAGKLHVISIEEDASPVLNSTLRTQHPIDSIIPFDNLDEKLYETQKDSTILKYNRSFDKVKDAIEKLKSIVRGSSKDPFLRGCQLKVENDALAHLFLAAINLINGEYGMPLDRNYEIKIMKWQLKEAHPRFIRYFEKQINKLQKDSDYPVDSFIEEIKRIKKEQLSMYRAYALGLPRRAN